MNEAQRKLHDMFEAYKHSSDYKDATRMVDKIQIVVQKNPVGNEVVIQVKMGR